MIAAIMPSTAKMRRPRCWPLREIVNATIYVMRGSIDWRLLLSNFLPKGTVFRWFCRFRDDCLFEKINHRLQRRTASAADAMLRPRPRSSTVWR